MARARRSVLALVVLLTSCTSEERDALRATTTVVTTYKPVDHRPPVMTFPPTTSTTTTTTTTTIPAPPPPAATDPQGPSVSWPPYQPLAGVTGVAALTGLALDDATAALPIVAAKIDNTRPARGQWGLDGADVIFEENVEGITRFIALFQSRMPSQVGPVRSARTGDLYLLSGMNRPILAWSGGNKTVTKWVESAESAGRLVNFSALKVRCYFRSSTKSKPHNLVLDLGCARNKATAAGPARPLWEFAPAGTFATGAPTGAFDVDMSGVKVHWVWDAVQGYYVRYQDGAVHTTAGGVPITSTNVIIVYCEHISSPADGRSKVPVTVGGGRVVIHSGGMMRSGTWTRVNDTDPWTFTADDGTPILLLPGTSFVELSRA